YFINEPGSFSFSFSRKSYTPCHNSQQTHDRSNARCPDNNISPGTGMNPEISEIDPVRDRADPGQKTLAAGHHQKSFSTGFGYINPRFFRIIQFKPIIGQISDVRLLGDPLILTLHAFRYPNLALF